MRAILFFVVFLSFFLLDVKSQSLCQGNLGENIFAEGDFGVGSSMGSSLAMIPYCLGGWCVTNMTI